MLENTAFKLQKQEDWPAWFDFIRSKAEGGKVWKFMDPDDPNPPSCVEPDISIYIQDPPTPDDSNYTTPTATETTSTTPAGMDLDQLLTRTDRAGRMEIYRHRLARYQIEERNLTAVTDLIRTTVGTAYATYIQRMKDPHELLTTLMRVAKPSNETLQEAIEAKLTRLNMGPRRIGIESWLALHSEISQMAEQVEDPPPEASTKKLIRHLIRSSERINPAFYSAYYQFTREGKITLTLEEAIENFNLTYHPTNNHRAAFPTLAGESVNTNKQTSNPPTTSSNNRHQRDCKACGGKHNVTKCRNLFEELRPEGWVVNERQERRCQEYLKTSEGRTLYKEQKQYFAKHPPQRPSLQPTTGKRKASSEPGSPKLSAAAVFLPPQANPSAASTVRSPDDINLATSWLYDTGANTHVANNINYFLTYEHQPGYMTTGASSSEIHGYGDVKLSIECGSRTRILTLKHVAYCPGFHTNLIAAGRLLKAGVKIDQDANTLVYRQTETLFADLISYDEFHLVKAHAYENPTPSAYTANSTKVPNQPGTEKVWHQRMGHCNMESIRHLPAAAEGVVLIKDPPKATVFGPPLCEPCIMGNMQQQTSRRPAPTGSYPFERTHFDVIILGTKGKSGFGGSTCIAHFWCDYTKYHRAWPLPNHQQSTLLPLFESILAFAKKFGPGVKWIHSDDEQGIGTKIEALLDAEGVIWEISTPDTPEQNGAAERSGRTITHRGRTILYEAKLPIHLWAEIVYTIIYLLNRTPIKSLCWKTPHEALYGSKPRLFGVRVVGSLAYTLIQGKDRVDSDKFNPRALKGYLVGFEASNIYRIWMPTTNRVIRTRDVKIDESTRYEPPSPTSPPIAVQELEDMNRIQDLIDLLQTNEYDWIEDLEAITPQPLPPTRSQKPGVENGVDIHLPTPPSTPENPLLPEPQQASSQGQTTHVETSLPLPLGGGETQLATQPEPTRLQPPQTELPQQPFDSQSLQTESIQQQSDPEPPQTELLQQPPEPEPSQTELLRQPSDLEAETGRRSKRQRTLTQRAVEMPNPDLRRRAFHADFPPNESSNNVFQAFFAAAERHYKHRDELPSEPKSWKDLTNHPLERQFKAAAHNEMRTLIAKHTWDECPRPPQAYPLPTKWVFKYKEDTSGYVNKLKARLCVRGDLQQGINKQDVSAITGAVRTFRLLMALTAAFDLEVIQLDAVNAFINAELDHEVYIEYPEGYKAGKDRCLRLRKALYGLRKSPKLWFVEFSTTLRSLGLNPVPDEPCLLVHPTKLLMIYFYVDDILLFSPTHLLPDLEALCKTLMETYEMRRMDEFQSFLNTTVKRDRPTKRLWLHQQQYIEHLVTKYHQEFAPATHTPLSGQSLQQFEGEATPDQVNSYQQRIGSILYPATTLRPDVAYAASRLAAFMQNPSQEHLAEANRVIAYLYTTRSLAIEYSADTPQPNPNALQIASDASFADDSATRRSTQGYIIKLFNGPIIWQSSKQPTVSTSTTEAELLALSHVGKEVQFMARIFKAIRFNPEQSLIIECDNQQAVRIVSAEAATMTTKLRHIDIHQFWLRQEAQQGKFVIQWVPTAEMMADGLTKPLNKQAHKAFLEMLNLKDV